MKKSSPIRKNKKFHHDFDTPVSPVLKINESLSKSGASLYVNVLLIILKFANHGKAKFKLKE